MPSKYTIASLQEILDWIVDGIFTVDLETAEIISPSGRVLTTRINPRRGMSGGDLRVDLRYGNKRRSMHVSRLVWMASTHSLIPDGYEIHHLDEDRMNNHWENLICLHPQDHIKFHQEFNDVPF